MNFIAYSWILLLLGVLLLINLIWLINKESKFSKGFSIIDASDPYNSNILSTASTTGFSRREEADRFGGSSNLKTGKRGPDRISVSSSSRTPDPTI